MRWYVLGTRQALIKYSKYSHSRPPSHHSSPFRLGLLTLPYSTAVTGFEGPPCLASNKCICFSMNKKGEAPIQPLQPTFHWAVRIILRSKALISLLPCSKNICGSLSITLKQGPQCLASLSTVNSPLLGTTHFPAYQNSAAGSCFSTTPTPPITPAKEKNYVCSGYWKPHGEISPWCSPNQNLLHQSGRISALFFSWKQYFLSNEFIRGSSSP